RPLHVALPILPGLGAQGGCARAGDARLHRSSNHCIDDGVRSAFRHFGDYHRGLVDVPVGVRTGMGDAPRRRRDRTNGPGREKEPLKMLNWKDRVSMAAPRLAIVAHDLAMVWLCWAALHHFRYAMLPAGPAPGIEATEILLVLLAQGAVFWQ